MNKNFKKIQIVEKKITKIIKNLNFQFNQSEQVELTLESPHKLH